MSIATSSGRGGAGRRRLVHGVLPGFGLAMGWTVVWLSLIVLFPLVALAVKASGLGFGGFVKLLQDARVQAALELSFGAALIAALVNAVFGVLVAWVLTRYRFPGRALIDAAVDLPFALPTAVAGITLAALFAKTGWIGGLLAPLGIEVAYTRLGVVVALIFVGLPFVVRTVQPLLADLDREVEEAAATLGASRLTTVFRVLLPPLVPSILTGFTLAFARGVGEYGSIVFIAGNMPYLTEIAPLLIVIKLEEFDWVGATGIACVMLAISFSLLLVINLIQAHANRRS
ncbi:sulfate ABC transporter permease subunit CysT [Siculibacillus lacustris]|uniref:Sulfate transport system permease protein CysT n=1 Tax=Siculibacillus lacustris TaxID=1549641 RepID=A0A4Q9VXP3_9HYPH|nr:sulfate ABC transporter permease subunit CysT [Siculibacillus lacustris]TBW40694.1 sulfate ABC transporter permease subunit CysT [Siculibacillus lacustris]